MFCRNAAHWAVVMDIGFIGLGNMGGGIAAKLLKPGRRLKVWNRSPEPMARLETEGATAVSSAAEALDTDVAFSMLANDDVIEAVIVASGALDKARPGLIHVNLAQLRMQAGDLGAARALYERYLALGPPDEWAATARKAIVYCMASSPL